MMNKRKDGNVLTVTSVRFPVEVWQAKHISRMLEMTTRAKTKELVNRLVLWNLSRQGEGGRWPTSEQLFLMRRLDLRTEH